MLAVTARADHLSCRRGAARASTLWGDGFAGDGLAEFWSMSDWSHCSSDEYVMMFPQLLPRNGALAAPLMSHLEICVAVRAWRLSRLTLEGIDPELRSVISSSIIARQLHRDWFLEDGAGIRLLRQLGLLRPCLEGERWLLTFIDGLLAQLQHRVCPDWTEEAEVWFAFGSGIHPAYLWPASAISPARGCTAAWLGHLDRGRSALMPLIVAEYLLDAVVGNKGATDRSLNSMVGAGNAQRLRRAAERRCAGHDPTVTMRQRGRRFVATAQSPRTFSSVPEHAVTRA